MDGPVIHFLQSTERKKLIMDTTRKTKRRGLLFLLGALLGIGLISNVAATDYSLSGAVAAEETSSTDTTSEATSETESSTDSSSDSSSETTTAVVTDTFTVSSLTNNIGSYSSIGTYSGPDTGNGRNSGATYSICSWKGTTEFRLRSTAPSGIVSTISGGTITNVRVYWGTSGTGTRTLTFYGSNQAYDSLSESTTADDFGTSLGTLSYDTSNVYSDFPVDGSYSYIGVRATSANVVYLTSIVFTWEPTTKASITLSPSTVEIDVSESDQTVGVTLQNLTEDALTLSSTSSDYYEITQSGSGSSFTLTISATGKSATSSEGVTVTVAAGSVSATLTIIVTAKSTTTFTKVTSITSADIGYNFVIGYEGESSVTLAGIKSGSYLTVGSGGTLEGSTLSVLGDVVELWALSNGNADNEYSLWSNTGGHYLGHGTNVTQPTTIGDTCSFSITVSDGLASITNDTSTALGFNLTNYFSFYSTSTNGGNICLYKASEQSSHYTASLDWATNFLSVTAGPCTNKDGSAIADVWSTVSGSYANLANQLEKDFLTWGTDNEDGSNDIEKALARYDHIVSKYSSSITDITDFLGRNPTTTNSSILYSFINNDDASSYITIGVIGGVTIILIASYMVITNRKKKEEEK